jgi:tetratricopeptide (TPR) repeat protein
MGNHAWDDPRCNVVLEQLLGRAGWTPENLGDHLNRLAATLGLKVHVNRRYPRRWVYAEKDRATPRIPRDPLPSLVCLLFYQRLGDPVTPEMVGWPTARGVLYVPADDGLRQAWDGAGAIAALGEVVDADSMERRHFLAMTGLNLTAVAHQWLLDPARVAASVLGKRVDHAVVDDLERVAEARRRLDDALGGGSLLPATREDLRLVVALLKNSSYTEEIGRRLYAVAAEFARLAAWLAYDTGQPALAQRYFMAALRAAHVSGDRAIGANVLGFMSVQAAQSSIPRDAVVLAESALTAEQVLTPAVAASLYGRLALGAAYTGDATGCLRAQTRAFDLLSRSVSENEPPWIYWFTEADAQGLAGWSLLALGRSADAEPHLRRAIALLDPSFARDRAGMLCDLATARLGTGAVERACTTAGEAATIIRRLDSPRQSRLLADFRRAAEPYASSAVIREFDAKYRDLIMT